MKVSIEKNVVCHIAGIDQKLKDLIGKKYGNNPEIIIDDLDILNQEIKDNEKMNYLFNQWTKFKEKNNDKFKTIEKEMDRLWQNLFQDHIMDKINNNRNKRIVFYGDNNHYKHLSKKIDLPTTSRFYLKVDDKEHCHDLVKDYLLKFQDDIILGTFPLSFLDHSFIINRRKRISKYFHNWGYDLKNYDEIMDFLDLTINQKKMESLDYLYYASKMPYYIGSNIHPEKDKTIFAFSNPWEALEQLISTKIKVKLEIEEGKPIFKELKKGEFNKLKFKGYLYQLDKKTFIPNGKKNLNKFKSNLPAKIFRKDKFYNLKSISNKYNIKYNQI